MIEFNVAAREHEAKARPDEDVVDVPIDGVMYQARRPTVAQAAALNLTLGQKGFDRLTSIFYLIESLLGDEALKAIKRLIWERRVDYADLIGTSPRNPQGGLIDQIFAEFAERPTLPSDDSSPSPAVVGRRSTGRSRGRGSVDSTSPSTSSSTTSSRGPSRASTKKPAPPTG